MSELKEENKNLKFVEVDSSNIAGVCIEALGESVGNLYVDFKVKGYVCNRYKYHNLPLTLIEELLLSESKGKFLNANIKEKYQFINLGVIDKTPVELSQSNGKNY